MGEWELVKPENVEELNKKIKDQTIYVEGSDVTGIISGSVYNEKYLGALMCPFSGQFLNPSTKLWQDAGKGAVFITNIRIEENPKSNEPPINMDSRLIGGGSASPYLNWPTHWPEVTLVPSNQQVVGSSFSDMLGTLKKTKQNAKFNLAWPLNKLNCFISTSCTADIQVHEENIKKQGFCSDCKPKLEFSLQ